MTEKEQFPGLEKAVYNIVYKVYSSAGANPVEKPFLKRLLADCVRRNIINSISDLSSVPREDRSVFTETLNEPLDLLCRFLYTAVDGLTTDDRLAVMTIVWETVEGCLPSLHRECVLVGTRVQTYRLALIVNSAPDALFTLHTQRHPCSKCSAAANRPRTLREFLELRHIPPLHYNCRCRLDEGTRWYDALLRIPEDAKNALGNLVKAQYERFISIRNPIDFLDYMLYGALSASRERGEVMFADPSLYNIGNWLTMGAADTVKGALYCCHP